MHLLWGSADVPAAVRGFADLVAQWAGWDEIAPRDAAPPADAVLLDWSPEPPRRLPDLPSLWMVRAPVAFLEDDGAGTRPRHLRPVGDVRPTRIAFAQPTQPGWPGLPMPADAAPVALPNAIPLAYAPSGAPAVVGLQGRDGAPPAVYVGVDLGSLILAAVGAARDCTLGTIGHPVRGQFHRTGEGGAAPDRAWVNDALDSLAACCAWLSGQARRPVVSLGRFPQGAAWALGLSHDVAVCRRSAGHLLHHGRLALASAGRAATAGDFGRAGRALAGGVASGLATDPWAVADCLAADEALGVRSTFCFYAKETAATAVSPWASNPEYSLDEPRVRTSVGAVIDGGGEVALLAGTSAWRRPGTFAHERRVLESVVGQPVAGVRQFGGDGEAPALWREAEAAQFRYDTSWGYVDRPGMRAGVALPYRPWDCEEERVAQLWELPPVLAEAHLRDGAVRDTDDVLAHLRAAGGAGALAWSQRSFAGPDHPLRRAYERLVADAKASGAWVGPCGALIEWWEARARLRWTVRREGDTWAWALHSREPLARVPVRIHGVVPGSVELGADADARVKSAVQEGAVVLAYELGPDRPLEFRAKVSL